MDEESFIPDIIPPEIKDATPKEVVPGKDAVMRVEVLPKKPTEKATVPVPEPFHVHHAIVGLGIVGASMLVMLVPTLKPITKVAIAGLGATIGALLVYDDIVQHQEGNCDIATIFSFKPCVAKVTVVKKP